MDALVDLSLSNSLADLAARIRDEHEQAASAMQVGRAHARTAGELLNAAKAQVEHGRWEAWVSEHCGIHKRLAQHYMRIAIELPKLDPAKAKRVSLLSFREAIHLLADNRKAVAVMEAAEAEPEKYGPILDDMENGGNVDRSFKLLKIARARDAYEARKEQGGMVADLEALAASGFRASGMLADPPWLYETRTESGKVWTSADNHFKPMTLDEIKAFGERYVVPLAADDCLLGLWVPWPLLLATGDVMAAWGFEYSTDGFNWVKTNPMKGGLHWGNGYLTRSNSEICLLGIRGNPMRLDEGVIMAPWAGHSVKPEEAHARIERLVAGPYMEFFGRRLLPRWWVYGDEVPWRAPE